MTGPGRIQPRSGYALLAVLWVLVGASTVVTAGTLLARDGLSAARNRMELTRAAWRAEACVEHARSAIGRLLPTDADGTGWQDLDRRIATDGALRPPGCTMTLEPSGLRLDVNRADAEMLRRILWELDGRPHQVDSLVAALQDWIDPDSIPRAGGAEANWYTLHRRPPPRNGPVGDARELSAIRGFERLSAERLLGTEGDRILLTRAPAPVLRALPGMTGEGVARLLVRREGREGAARLIELESDLAPAARAEFRRHFPELAVRTTDVPEAWIVTGRAAGAGGVAVLELRLVRAGARAAIARRRSWIE